MPEKRFYIDAPLQKGNELSFDNEEARHIQVMRLRKGDRFEVVNGKGTLAECSLLSTDKASVQASVEAILEEEPLPRPLIISQALPRLNRIDVILEKGTELGMTHLRFFPGDLSEKKEISLSQMERFRKITISALKQSGTLYLPEISLIKQIEAWEALPCITFYGETAKGAPPLLKVLTTLEKSTGIHFIVGPEKGFSKEEMEKLKLLGAKGVSLHKNILRTDTAPLAALAVISNSRI